jgi:phosphoglycolate phosphatase-like HAD superfamily hydrolase
MLDAIAAAQENPITEYFYIGDMPDDMVAAKKSKAGYKGVGLLLSAPDKTSLKKELLRAGADDIIKDFKQLISSIESG